MGVESSDAGFRRVGCGFVEVVVIGFEDLGVAVGVAAVVVVGVGVVEDDV